VLEQREVTKVVADILMSEMALDAEHCLLGDQQYALPADDELFVVVFDDGFKPLGGTKFIELDPASENYLHEVQQYSGLHDVRVEVMSFSNAARLRIGEVAMALNSIYAQQLSEQYQIQIADRIKTPVNATAAEETGMLFRYSTHVNVTAMHQKVKPLPFYNYYDKYNGALQDGTAKSPEVTINE